MLESLTIRNFQKHKKLNIKFDPHVTTIVGPNDAGKSAIIRALSWVAFNRPIGRAFIRHGAKLASVTLRYDGSKIIRRTEGPSKRLFSLNSKRFKAFGRDVPREITEALRIESINFQRHHDSIFWFALTPGQLAKELNKLVDLDTIDKVQAIVAKRIKDTKTELEVHKLTLQEAITTVESLKWVLPLDVKIDKLETRHSDIALKSNKMARLRDAIGLAVVYAGRCRKLASGAAAAAAAGALAASVASAVDRASRLAMLVERLLRASHAAGWKLPAGRIDQTANKVDQLRRLVSLLSQMEETSCQLERRLQQKKKKLEEKLGGRCPSCGGILTDQTWL